MTTVTVHSRSLIGLMPCAVRIEAEPSEMTLAIAGLPTDAARRETTVRVRSALESVRAGDISARVTVIGHPYGSAAHLDLAIAAAVLAAHGRIAIGEHSELVVLGELAFDGTVKPVRGIGPMLADCANSTALVPAGNASEASYCEAWTRPVEHLRDLLQGASVPATIEPAASEPADRGMPRGIVLVGPAGCGKTVVAREMAQALAFQSSPELDAVYSVAAMLPPEGTVTRAPFRSPHHTVSVAGLVGAAGRPGEVSLAHSGVLFLDELTDFRLDALDAVFSAIRLGRVESRVSGHTIRFPARPALVIGAAEDSNRLRSLLERYKLAAVAVERFNGGIPIG